MQKHYNYLDIDLDSKNYRRLRAMQGDIKSRYILVNLYSNNLSYDLSGCTVKIYGLKRDKTIFFNNAVIKNTKLGQFEIELTNQALAVAGELKIQILILGSSGEKLTSSAFFIDVGESIIDENAIESTNEFGALIESLTKVNEWDSYFEETSGKIEEKYTERLNSVDSQIKENEKNLNEQLERIVSLNGDVSKVLYSLKKEGIQVTKTRYINTDITVIKIPYKNADGSINKIKKHIWSDWNTEVKLEYPRLAYEEYDDAILSMNANGMSSNGKALGWQIKDGASLPRTSFTLPLGTYTLGVKRDGTLKAYLHDNTMGTQMLADGVENSFCFTVPLIMDGVEVADEILEKYANYLDVAERQIIGQDYLSKDYYIITCDGRTETSTGLTYPQCREFCKSLGLSIAYQLDGGGSVQTVLGGSMVNVPFDNSYGYIERKTIDSLVFVTESQVGGKYEGIKGRMFDSKFFTILNEIFKNGVNKLKGTNVIKAVFSGTWSTIGIVRQNGVTDTNNGIVSYELGENAEIIKSKLLLGDERVIYRSYTMNPNTNIFAADGTGIADVSGKYFGSFYADSGSAVADANELTKSGIYYFNNSTLNRPADGGLLVLQMTITTLKKQIAYEINGVNYYVRQYNTSTSAWSQWKKVTVTSTTL